VNAVRAGLVQDGFTGWFVALVVAVTALVWLTVAIIRALEREDDQPPAATHVVNDCDRGGHWYKAVAPEAWVSLRVWRCVNCGDVRTAPKTRGVYDQEAS
jgi:hypothetical protein